MMTAGCRGFSERQRSAKTQVYRQEPIRKMEVSYDEK